MHIGSKIRLCDRTGVPIHINVESAGSNVCVYKRVYILYVGNANHVRAVVDTFAMM